MSRVGVTPFAPVRDGVLAASFLFVFAAFFLQLFEQKGLPASACWD